LLNKCSYGPSVFSFILTSINLLFLPLNKLKMNKLLLTCLTFLTISLSYAQKARQNDINDCGTDAYMEQLLKEHPELLEKQKQSERFYQSEVKRKSQQASWRSAADVVTIPVVIHVMHLPGTPVGTAENISDAQIQTGMLHLNQAYRKLTSDFNGIGRNPNIVGADVELEFCLAKQDPNGNPTDGIDRVATTLSNTVVGGTAVKYLSSWNTDRYLNIWLVKSIYNNTTGSYIGGFANYPWYHGSPTDGVVNLASRFGRSVTSTLCKTHIHEVGHWLGLSHTHQGGCRNDNCLADGDNVCDTPPELPKTTLEPCLVLANNCHTDEDDTNIRNPFRPVAMGGLGDQVDLHEDYMDYTDSVGCVFNTFTEGQKTRMRAALDFDRVLLKSSLGCVPVSTAPTVFFQHNTVPPYGYEAYGINSIDCRYYEDINVPIKVFNSPSGVTVDISVGTGTATNISDFQLMTPNVIIPAGSTTGNAILRIFNDVKSEIIETGVLNISSATSGVTSSNVPYVFSIDDDDDGYYSNVSSNMSSVTEYLGSNETVKFISSTGLLFATIQNLSNHDYGCTTVEIDRAGATTTSSAGKIFTTKTFKVTPTNNNAMGSHRTTLYYTPEEVSAWTTATGASTSAMSIFKSSGAIGVATSLVEGTSVSVTSFATPTGTPSTAFSATFNTGFSGFGVANNTVLAVDLLAFEGIKGNKNVKLRWKTASEKNNDYFVIEKSRDGQTFEAMTKVTSQGISSDVLNYETLDNAPVAGMNYYRLKSVDKVGQVATSKVVSVAFVEKIKLMVYPNPTTSSKINVELTSDRDDRIDFEVVDIVGKTVHTISQNVTNGLNTIAFDNLTVSKGIYFIRAKQNNVVTAVVRFVRL
jgi:Pregnancy-associated plasma protein-A/Secretion system C-terminal sorting domain